MSENRQPSATQTRHRWRLLEDLDSWLQWPMIVLSLVWFLLVVAELVWGASEVLETFGTIIWVIFILEFAVRISLAPDKSGFLARNWLTLLALVVPALRMFRILSIIRLARLGRGFRLIRIIGTANRSMGALKRSFGRRRVGFVLSLTVLVVLLGAGGMLAFEPSAGGQSGFSDYGSALWWTSMIVMTMGTEFWPKTTEGRILCLLLALYGFTVFGYITASFASFFVERDRTAGPKVGPSHAELRALRDELALLRRELGETHRLGTSRPTRK